MKFGQATRRMILGAGFLALPLAGCVPENTTAVEPKKAEAKVNPHDPTGASAGDLLQMVEQMKGDLKNKDRDFNINLALGNLFYDNGKYIDAIEYFTDAMKRAEPSLAQLQKVDRQASGPVPEACALDKPLPEDVAKGQRQRSFEAIVKAAGELGPAEANACLKQLVPLVAGLQARRGNSWYLVGNAEKAQVDHGAALVLDPENPEALFFSGAATLETSGGDEAKIAEGRAHWEKLLKAHPNHPRAELVRQTLPRIPELFGKDAMDPMAAHPPVAGAGANPHGANPHAGMAMPGPLPAGMEQVAQNTPQTPELEKHISDTLAKGEELLKAAKWEEALSTFKTIMPIRPSAQVALGMGIALRELGKPTAEMVLTQATKMPGGDVPRAKFELAKFYEAKSPAQAKSLYSEISGDATYGAQAKQRLSALK